MASFFNNQLLFMRTSIYKLLLMFLTVVIVILLGVAWHFDMKFQAELRHESDLWVTIRDFDRVRDHALQSEPEEAVQDLYFFSSIAPREGTSPGENIFEAEKENAIREIITYLRAKTGENLGDDPNKWIDKYAKRRH